MFGRDKLAQIVSEFMGTAVLASVIFSMTGRTDFPFFAALAAGLTLVVMQLALGPTSGAHLNPVVTIGMWTLRKISTAKAVVFIAAQMLGGLAAWQLIEYLLNTDLASTASKAFDWRVFTAEVVGTFIFTFGVVAVLSKKYDAGVTAITIGGSLALGMMIASFASNGILNPAVAVGIQSWSWTYATAPIVGAIVGMNLYPLLFAEVPARTVKAATTIKRMTAKKRK